MGAHLNNIYVIDCEATCWPNQEERAGQPNELIEIGVAVLHTKTAQVTARGSIVIKPRFSTVSSFCTELTGWTQAAVDEQGLDIVQALEKFQEQFKITRNHVWCSYGEYDRHMLSSLTGSSGLAMYGIQAADNPFDRCRSYLNIKTLMALKHKFSREIGMSKALNFYNETLEGRHHNGADDAFNIAKITAKVLS